VNRHQDKAIETTISNQYGKLAGKATVTEINSPDLKDENSVNEQKVKPVEKNINTAGDNFTYSFPAHSFTQIRIKLTL
jgi:alpha-N-arabinofuranosidase